MSAVLQNLVNQPYQHGFVTDIEADVAPKGLSEDTIRLISGRKNEPEWLLELRLSAYRQWLKMEEPQWPNIKYPKIDFQAISHYSAPKPKKTVNSMDEVDPEFLRTFEKLGVPMNERAKLAGVAVDVIFDSVSVATTRDEEWRFTDISPLTRLSFQPVRTASRLQAADVERFYLGEAATRLVFVDGVYAPQLSSVAKDLGVVVTKLSAAVSAHAAAIEPHLGRHTEFQDNVFAGVRDLPTRVKCAILPWHTLHAAFNSVAGTSIEAENDPMHAPIGNAWR